MNLNETKELLIARITYYLEPHLGKLHHYCVEDKGDKIELIGATDDKTTSLFVLIRIVISEESKKIFVSNIYLPDFMRHLGIGRKLIKVIFKAAKELQYELFIDRMTKSFHESMRKRGALECKEPDMLKIVDGTMLD